MTKADILNIPMTSNSQIRTILSVTRLNKEYEKTRLFDLIAAKVSAHFSVNADIHKKIEKRGSYVTTWQNTCTRLFTYLLGPAEFLNRKDKDELVCMPICGKIDDKPALAINIYDKSNRLATIFYKDPEYDNQFSFYTDKLVSYGPWLSKVRDDVQYFNIYGLNLDVKSDANHIDNIMFNATMIQPDNAYGNTITVHDIFAKINSIKNNLCQRKL